MTLAQLANIGEFLGGIAGATGIEPFQSKYGLCDYL